MHSGVTLETLISTRGHWIALLARRGKNGQQRFKGKEKLGEGAGFFFFFEGSQVITNNFLKKCFAIRNGKKSLNCPAETGRDLL